MTAVLNLTFPDYKQLPPEVVEFRLVLLVSLPVSPQFRQPVFPIGRGLPRPALAVMPVPPTAVYKDYFAPGGKDKIGFSGEVFPMESIPITHRVD